ncbi:MAG: sulfotransferase [Sphingomonadales bacterium]
MDDRRLSHPLCGADLATLARVFARGGLGKRGIPQALASWGSAIGRLPFTVGEWVYAEAKRGQTTPIKPPVFILGHWRSGTTHLYNVMSEDKQWGIVTPFATGLPWEVMSLGRMFRPLLRKGLPEHRYIDNVPVEDDSPQEDEIALANMTDISFYHGLYFPKKFEKFFGPGVFFEGLSKADIERWQRTLNTLYLRLTLDQDGRQLLIKNPVYTARPKLLAQQFPGAKFIHIHRNPYKVFVSMRNFWKALFKEFALSDYDHIDIDQLVFDTYKKMMDAYIDQTKDMKKGELVEFAFDEFQKDPIACLENVYNELGLKGFDEAHPKFAAYLDDVKGYKKNKFDLDDDLKERIGREWGAYFKHWGYALD